MNLDFYRKPVDFSAAGRHAPLLASLPHDVGALARLVQGLLIHEHLTETYGVALPRDRLEESHVRPTEGMITRILGRDPRPLSIARAPGNRYVCVCRSFALLMVALLRHHNVPARARCGFGAYFEKAKFVDHWVAEYWHEQDNRWVMVDAQIDDLLRRRFAITFDTLDVPRDQFLVAGDAWRLCRGGKADAKSFGILDMWGCWFIASNLVRDAAALNNHEMLPWDVWGAMRQNDADLDLTFLDRLAELTRQPDKHFEEIRALYTDERIHVPKTVFNAALSRPEAA